MSAADPTLIVSRPRLLLLPLAAGLMLAAGLVLAATMGLNHDAAWQLYAARALIRGSTQSSPTLITATEPAVLEAGTLGTARGLPYGSDPLPR